MKAKNEKLKTKIDKKEESAEGKVENKNLDAKNKLKSLREELDKLRLDHVQGKLKNVSFLTTKRKEIARLLTAMQLKKSK